jgi:outer membrane protein
MTPLFLATMRVLTLADALHIAAQQPQNRQAHANTMAAEARADEARAPLLPQLSGNALYQRATANFAPRPGSVPSPINKSTPNSFATFNFFSFGLTLNQLVYDFGVTSYKWRAQQALAVSSGATEKATRLSVEQLVRNAYFTARANRALVEVAKETLANQDRHLGQIEGFVRVGTRPEIDLAQARTDRANAQVQLINSENGYETAKAQLNLAMGVDGPPDYDVGDEAFPAVEGEDESTQPLLDEALKARPDVAALDAQVRAQVINLRGLKGGYGPALGVSTSLTDAGTDLDNLAWNWNATANLSWSIFSGLQTWATIREGYATRLSLEAQRDGLKQQVRLDVEQGRLAVRAAKAALAASDEALVNARERLRLAEGRYSAGVGNVIELGDAQVAFTNAGAQRVQAEFNLATARAQLLRALGR